MYRSRTHQLLTMMLFAAAAVPSLASASPAKALHQTGRWLVDTQGRAVVLHGVNQVSKLPPYLPSAIGFGGSSGRRPSRAGPSTRSGRIPVSRCGSGAGG